MNARLAGWTLTAALVVGAVALVAGFTASHRWREPATRPAAEALLRSADLLLKKQAWSLVDKTVRAPSGDRHDYFSVSPCWWPDPDQPKGRPYVWRDGRPNPGNRAGRNDPAAFLRMSSGVETLALAYRLSGRERYARKAAHFLRVWFLDPATRMNPHLLHADTVPGIARPSPHGIYEFRHIVRVIDAIDLIRGSSAWSAKDHAGWNAWLASYHRWLTTSEQGKAAQAMANHHGSWYDVQVARLAVALGQRDAARDLIQGALHVRVAVQIQPDGSQPLELTRQNPLACATQNAEALFRLGLLADELGVAGWWSDVPPAGGGVVAAFNHLATWAEARPRQHQDAEYNRVALLCDRIRRRIPPALLGASLVRLADSAPSDARPPLPGGLP